MTTLQEIQDTTARNAIGDALEASRDSYGDIKAARNGLNEMESSGVYAEGYVAEQREQAADRVRQSVEGRLESARSRVASAVSATEGRLDRMTAVKPDELAAAQSAIGMFLGDLREEPRQLLAAYEQSFDVPADRRAIEEIAARAFRVLPDDPKRGMFEADWNRLRDRLESRLPYKQREPRLTIGELERAADYLANVEVVVTAAIKALLDPRQRGNLTAFTKVSLYEEELTRESAVEKAIPMATAVG